MIRAAAFLNALLCILCKLIKVVIAERVGIHMVRSVHALLTNIVVAWNTSRTDGFAARLKRDGVGIETAVGCARAGCDGVRWQGLAQACSAPCLGLTLRCGLVPSGGAT